MKVEFNIDGNETVENAIRQIKKWIDEAEKGEMIHWGDLSKRYILGEKGELETYPLICIGANPSTAGSNSDHPTDPTITKIRNIVKEINENGEEKCDGWIMLNLYPQRTPNPQELHKEETYDKTMMEKNHEIIGLVFAEFKNAKTLLAWGNIVELKDRGYLKDSIKKIASIGGARNWYIRGAVTGKNNPRHQLYVKGGTRMEPVKIDEGGVICKIDTQGM